jgi:hypothetical protein
MTARLVLLSLVTIAVTCPAAEGSRIANVTGTDDLRLLVGIAPPIRSGKITDIRVTTTPLPFDQDLDATGGVGPRGGIRYLHGVWVTPAWGFKLGGDAFIMQSKGAGYSVDSTNPDGESQPFTLQAAGVGLSGGPSFRIDTESLDYAGDFLEVEFLLSAAPAHMTATNDGVESGSAYGVVYGVSGGLVLTTMARWQTGIEVGYQGAQVNGIRWKNTGDASITAGGLSAALAVGHRW